MFLGVSIESNLNMSSLSARCEAHRRGLFFSCTRLAVCYNESNRIKPSILKGESYYENSKIIGGICAAVAIAAVVGALLLVNNDNDSEPNTSDTNISEQNPDAKVTITEAMQKIKPGSTQEEITEIIGFEPTTDAMIGSDPIWKFDSKNWISYKTYNDSVTIQATINKEDLKDENIKLPTASELQEKLNNGSFTYKELVEMVGGEGTLTSISDGSTSYTWVDKHDQRLGATFNKESGKCTVASYR